MKKVNKNVAIISAVGIMGITAIACIAVANGIDGTMMSSCVGAITLIVGGALGFRVSKGRWK